MNIIFLLKKIKKNIIISKKIYKTNEENDRERNKKYEK